MTIELSDHQKIVIPQLKTGSILWGGVGSGKSRTSIVYFYTRVCNGEIKTDKESEFSTPKTPKDLYIITPANKRDTLDWEQECSLFMLSKDRDASISGIKVIVDSWNNIKNYVDIENAFFIFDEQRVIGSGTWVKSFLKITKNNDWILLTATPGDTWMDYIPVFVANGYYKNRTEFIREHVVYNTFTRYPKVDHYTGENRLTKLKNKILIEMNYEKPTTTHLMDVFVPFNKTIFDLVSKDRWNPYENRPIKNAGELIHLMRRVVNSDPSRIDAIKLLFIKHKRLIIFYNFDYELYILRTLKEELKTSVSEYNGHKHELIPETDKWIYLVQYKSGEEAWECIETNCVIFYSMNYSYRSSIQAAGRIDRMNTTYVNLYIYRLRSESLIDSALIASYNNKKDFNEKKFIKKHFPKRKPND